MGGHATFVLNSGRPLLPAQYALLWSRAPTRVLLGGYGSGKTSGAALTLLAHAFANPWVPAYGDSRPFSIVMGKTTNVIRDSSYRELLAQTPPELIRKQWRTDGNWRLLLDNGHEIRFRTWSGSLEGANPCCLWLDEAHLLDPDAWPNLAARPRDPLAASTLLLVTGLPVFGWMRELWGPGTDHPGVDVVHASTYDNTYLPRSAVDRLRASCSAQEETVMMRGQWGTAANAVYYEWDPLVHLVDDPGDPQQPCHLSLDVGERGAVLWLQTRQRTCRTDTGRTYVSTGLHVVDELTPSNLSARAIARECKAKSWRLRPGVSNIYVDPATDRDEREQLEEAWPGVDVVRRTKGEKAYYVEQGIRAVNAALRDADRNVRLTVYRGLPRTDRSLVTAIPRLRRDRPGGTVVKDNTSDHMALDCLRYPVADLLPLGGSGWGVS